MTIVEQIQAMDLFAGITPILTGVFGVILIAQFAYRLLMDQPEEKPFEESQAYNCHRCGSHGFIDESKNKCPYCNGGL